MKFLLIPFFISLLIICFPFFPDLNFNIVKTIEKNIENNQTNIKLDKLILYIGLIFLFPFFLRLRLQSSHHIKLIMRYAIFIAFIYPRILPVHFMEGINGKIGYSFFVFCLLENKVRYEHWLFISLFYII